LRETGNYLSDKPNPSVFQENNMKKKIDPGLAYMQLLKIRPARDLPKFTSALARNMGKAAAEKLKKLNTKRMISGSREDNLAFYEYKNSSLEVSTLFSGLYEGDVYRRVCNWIQRNNDCFGKTILDVGCDNGIISCFLASSLPGCRIISTDRFSSASIIARKLAGKLELSNIEFRDVDIKNLTHDLKFDTIFSMRTIIENIDYSGYPAYARFSEKGKFYGDRLSEYAGSLAAHVKDTGNIISIERGEKPDLLLGWLSAMEKAGMAISQDRIEGITALELGDDACFQVAVWSKTDGQESNETSDIYDVWFAMVTQGTDFSALEHQGWEAEVLFENIAGERLKQITYRDKHGEMSGRIGLWTCSDMDDILLVFNEIGNKSQLNLYSQDMLAELYARLQSHKYQTTSRGFKADEE